MKPGVEILECLDPYDPGSAGQALKHLFNLMKVESKHRRVHSVDELLESIADSKFKFAHISTHGSTDEDEERFRGWWTPSDIGGRRRLSNFRGRIETTAIVSTACKSGVSSFGKYVVDELGSRYFIGPKLSPTFHNSIFFAHIFYHKLFKTKRSVSKAFNSYAESYKNPHKFTLFR